MDKYQIVVIKIETETGEKMDRIISYAPSSIPPKWELAMPSGNIYVYYDINADTFVFRSLEEISAPDFNLEYIVTTNEALTSSDTKYLIPVDNEFFHLFHDTIPAISRLHRDDKTAMFLIFKQHRRGSEGAKKSVQKLHDYLEEFLSEKNINYMLISAPDGAGEVFPIFYGSNFVDFRGKSRDRNSQPFMSFREIAEWSEDVRLQSGEPVLYPYRKVYLSRRHLKDIRGKTFTGVSSDYQGYKNDLRMDNEHLLEEFFSSKGYEIIIPEESFSTMREQIQYMKSVKVLASVTSSGLTNSLFMKNGQTVIEITAEVAGVTGHGSGGAHQAKLDYYLTDSFFKNHIHIGVPSNRDPSEVVARLERIIDLLD